MNNSEKKSRCKEALKEMKTYKSTLLPLRFGCRVYTRENVSCSDCPFYVAEDEV